jgi:hypothetical protein
MDILTTQIRNVVTRGIGDHASTNSFDDRHQARAWIICTQGNNTSSGPENTVSAHSRVNTSINEKYDRRVIIISPQECSYRRNSLCKFTNSECTIPCRDDLLIGGFRKPLIQTRTDHARTRVGHVGLHPIPVEEILLTHRYMSTDSPRGRPIDAGKFRHFGFSTQSTLPVGATNCD